MTSSTVVEGRAVPQRDWLWPMVGASSVFFAFYVFTAVRLFSVAGGRLIYALDDAYIHMAIARNVALHGVWGVQPEVFSASSSSPLWTALLAFMYRIFGVWDGIPLLLNSVFAMLGIVTAGLLLAREDIRGTSLFATLTCAVLLTPLAPMVWIGMEHALHILLTLIVVLVTTALARNPSRALLVTTAVVTALMIVTRYEGLFVLAGCVVVLVMWRRFTAALAVGTFSLLPIVGIGLWNLSHGWFFIPGSIMMRQTILGQPDISVFSSLATNVAHSDAPLAFSVMLVLAILILAYQLRHRILQDIQPALVIFVTAAVLHLGLAKFGYLWRYEAYLMMLGTISLAVSFFREMKQLPRRHQFAHISDLSVVLAGVVVLACGSRTIGSNAVTANVAGHIFRQHRQVARLLEANYAGRAVALNDIGNACYYTDAKIVDLVGLGSLSMATLRRAGLWDAEHINASLDGENAEVAVIYDKWFQGAHAFQKDWIRVAEWITDEEEQQTEGAVAFYARNDGAAVRLRRAVRDATADLPSGIESRVFESE